MMLLNEIKSEFESNGFDLEHESNMVQSRILSPIIEAIEKQGITQKELSEKTGLKQPFISALLNVRKKLNMEHIALFQKALGIVLQTPEVLTVVEHKRKFYSKDEYNSTAAELFENAYDNIQTIYSLEQYSESRSGREYSSKNLNTTCFAEEKKATPRSKYVPSILSI